MAKAATAFVDFEGDFSKIRSGTATEAKQVESSFNSSFKNIAKFAAVSLATVGAEHVLKDAFHAAEEAQQIQRQTASVIQSTGGAAHVTAGHVEDLGKRIEHLSGTQHDAVDSAENVLLTFSKVRNEVGKGNDVFDQATLAAANLSARFGIALPAAAKTVGKALNDPIGGLTALQRVGVRFTDQQKQQITTLTKSGHQLQAQGIILGELGKRFGGAAAASNTPSKQLSASFHDLEEALGKVLVPLVQKFVPVLTFIAQHPDVAIPIFAMAAGFTAMLIVNKVGEAVKAFKTTMVALNLVMEANPVLLVVTAIAALGFAVFEAYKHFGPFHDAVDKAWQILQSAFHWIQKNWPLLLAILTGPIGLAVLEITRHWSTIKNGFTAVKDWIGARVSDIVGFFKGLPGRIIGTIKSIASAALRVGQSIIGGIVSGVSSAIGKVADIGKAIANAAIGFINKFIIGGIRGGIHTIANALANVNIPGLGRFYDAASSLLNAAANRIPNIPTLDTGAVITGPTLALLAKNSQREIVTPERLMRRIVGDVFRAQFVDGGGSQRPIDARTIVQGNVYGDAHLRSIFDTHDRKLELELAAG